MAMRKVLKKFWAQFRFTKKDYCDLKVSVLSENKWWYFTFDEERSRELQWFYLSTEVKKWSPEFSTTAYFYSAFVSILQIFTHLSGVGKTVETFCFSFWILWHPSILWYCFTLPVILKSPLHMFTPVLRL